MNKLQHYDRTIVRVKIPQQKYEIVKGNEEKPAIIRKYKELETDEHGNPLIGGIVYERYFDFQHFLYDPSKFHGPENDYKMKNEYLIDDWEKVKLPSGSS